MLEQLRQARYEPSLAIGPQILSVQFHPEYSDIVLGIVSLFACAFACWRVLPLVVSQARVNLFEVSASNATLNFPSFTSLSRRKCLILLHEAQFFVVGA